MMLILLTGGLFLGWSLGKNNLSNLFGTAIGTRMVSLKTAVVLSILFIFLGALLSGQATTSNVLKMSPLNTLFDAFIVCVSAACVLDLASRLALPGSIAQTIIGALMGWNLSQGVPLDKVLIQKMAGAWVIAPFLAAFVAWSVMRLVRWGMARYSISLFRRDVLIRWGLVGAGILAAYSLGANNIGTIVGPYSAVTQIDSAILIVMVCVAVAVGCMMADRAVIKTVSNDVFPLSPCEAFVVMLGTALTMMMFTSQAIRSGMMQFNLPLFPLVPVPISNTMIGAIVGISLSRGGYGLRFGVLGRIILSWGFVPTMAGGLCFILMKGMAG